MKKTLLTALALGFASTMLMAGSTMASTISYDDDTITFPDYVTTNTTYLTKDSLGTPQVTGLDVNYTGTLLDSVVIYMDNRLVFDTLMINTGGAYDWDSWDYYAIDTYDLNADPSNYATPTNYEQGLYEVSPITTTTYADLSGTRIGHVNGLTSGLEMSSSFDPIWDKTNGTLTYDFSGFGINLDMNTFTIAYTPYCANDVILVGPGAPVPEPATMLLFGTGIAGLLGASRRRKKQA